jgi:hypothetical protein
MTINKPVIRKIIAEDAVHLTLNLVGVSIFREEEDDEY